MMRYWDYRFAANAVLLKFAARGTSPSLTGTLIRFSTRSTTIPIRLGHELIRVRHEYHLAAAQGLPSHGAAPELLARRRAAVHHAIGNERSGARARGAARLPAVRPHHAARDAHRVRREIPADRRSQPARARGGGEIGRASCRERVEDLGGAGS